ncbi:tetratricopeptide repeat protein [Phycisphaera mikurensis]|uniref:Uncharacterized protein n=1 Tax=Phycisphaera mikurensis (strain NBRC 102666 / KCTC 22515 / FYK2301M01) TaxID=1142394 RepID=I0IAJ8_PHYMF|nr:tetratricopeptide repeat protein [Phycisphaera mikurensis]MBB6441718.1 tetratricopeptide (TPR) repeat protein [Phycisphaera mikurensis]BAM02286.1 hypothetical protein PSMK_01270 [Phycisphaera mikurensis NBRC 102666]
MADRLDTLLRLHADDPADRDLPYMIGLEHAKAGANAEALAWLDKALEVDPSHHYAWFQKARVLSEEGEEDEAVAAARAGLERAEADGNAKAAGELRELLESL